MDWIKSAMGGDNGKNVTLLSEVFHEADRMGAEYMTKLMDRAKEIQSQSGDSMAATLLLFVGVLRPYGVAKQGMENTMSKLPNHPAGSMWTMLEKVLSSKTEDALTYLQNWAKEQGLE